MQLDDSDEGLHLPRAVETWQENYLFGGLDPARRAGFYVHIGRQHALDLSILKVVAFDGTTMVSTCLRQPLMPVLEADGLRLDVVKPLFAWRVRWKGQCDPAVAGYHCTVHGTKVAVEIDVEMSAVLTPILNDYGADGRDETITSGRHYEQGLRMTGTVAIDNVSTRVEGFAIRDHTWGTRRLVDVDCVWWTPMCSFGDRPMFVRSTNVIRGDSKTALALVMHPEGIDRYDAVDVALVDSTTPDPLCGTLTLSNSDDTVSFEFSGLARLPMTYLEGWGSRAMLSDETFASARFPDGTHGFAIVEWNRPLPDSDRDALTAALAAYH